MPSVITLELLTKSKKISYVKIGPPPFQCGPTLPRRSQHCPTLPLGIITSIWATLIETTLIKDASRQVT